MEPSATYQAIVRRNREEGRAEEEGETKYGPPDGKRLAFISNRGGGYDIYVMEVK